MSLPRKPDGEKQFLLCSDEHFDNLLFGLSLHANKYTHLFYKGFERNGATNNGLVSVDIKLSDIEFEITQKKINKLLSATNVCLADCACRPKDCPNQEPDCITYVCKSEEKDFAIHLHDFLTFMQFDLAITPLSELESVSLCYSQTPFDCKIVGYTVDVSSFSAKRVCRLVDFRELISITDQSLNNSVAKENNSNPSDETNNTFLCQKVNFKKARKILESQRKGLSQEAVNYQTISDIISIVNSCSSSKTCPYSSVKENENCTLIDKLLERQIRDCFGREYYQNIK